MIRIIIFILLTAIIEITWRVTWPKTPVYKRHFIIIVVACLLIVIDSITKIIPPHQSNTIVNLLIGFTGASFGLTIFSLPWLYSRKLHGMSWYQGVKLRQNPSKPLILVADPHWHESIKDLRNAQTAYPNADWLFLGDVFDLWLGIPGAESNIAKEFLTWVDETRSKQCWVGLWLGNREFFLDYLVNRFDLIGEGIGGSLPNEELYWEHGDLINSADWRYRLWNLISRSSMVWLLTRMLPKATVDTIANYIKYKIHTTNNYYKVFFPKKAFLEAAKENCGGTFITGHFHTHQTINNGIAIPWAKDGNFMVWSNGKVGRLIIDGIKNKLS